MQCLQLDNLFLWGLWMWLDRISLYRPLRLVAYGIGYSMELSDCFPLRAGYSWPRPPVLARTKKPTLTVRPDRSTAFSGPGRRESTRCGHVATPREPVSK